MQCISDTLDRMQYGAPVAGPDNEIGLPHYLQTWLESANRDSKRQALEAVQKAEGKG